MSQEMRELVSLGCRVLGAADHGDLIWGHLSARDPDGRGVWMKSHDLGFAEVTPEDVILVSWDGEVVVGDRRRHSEYPIHTEVTRARSDVGAVVHSHAATAVAFAALGVPLRPISHEANLFVPPDIPRFTKTGNLIRSAEMGRAVAATMGDERACFLVNHGIVVTGDDVQDAVLGAYLLEHACRTQLMAMSAGGWATWSPPEESAVKRHTAYSKRSMAGAWAYLVRSLPPQPSR